MYAQCVDKWSGALAEIRYSTWNDGRIAQERERLSMLRPFSMADRGRMGKINTELARRTQVEPRSNGWMETGYWLEHAAGPGKKATHDTVTQKPNAILAVYRRWLGAGFEAAIGYDNPLWGVEVARRATVAKNDSAVMGQIQRQEF